ncbi:MAG: DUF2550 domain-containing protein [Propionibacteriales bacterium]|nr:DUF2550 domain-containing protein [Propionibacteriales bacterium]
MQWWQAVLDSFGSVAIVVGLPVAFLFARRRWLSRFGGTFECSVRFAAAAAAGTTTLSRGWTLGLGRYAGDNLEWFRIFSFSPRPRYVFSRSMRVLGQRTPRGAEAFSLYAGHVVTDVELDENRRIELAMSERALTGFMAWTEGAPPGHDRLLA